MHGRQPLSPSRDRRQRQARPNGPLLAGITAIALLVGGFLVVTGNDAEPQSIASAAPNDMPSMTLPPAEVEPVALAAESPAIDSPTVDLNGCIMDVTQVVEGDTGDNVECVQKALFAAGYYDGEISGVFDRATDNAARKLQHERGLYTDGIVGARTAESLGIWPGAESFIVRTPAPAPGSMDSWGFRLSSVASTGSDAPPMPEGSGQGTGKRVVYDRGGQRTWAVDDDEQVIRSFLVTGSQYRNEVPGRHEVYSRSEVSTAWNFTAELPLMIRWLDTERGAIGFHAIPIDNATGELYQTEAELGQKMSGGCQRQAPEDAQFMWAFATLGTPVYVT